MQKHPRESDLAGMSDPGAIDQQPATPAAFQQEMAFVSNPEEAKRYAGQWVALAGDQVVAVGPRPKEVLADAEKRGHSDPVLHYFPSRDPDTMFWGGWS